MKPCLSTRSLNGGPLLFRMHASPLSTCFFRPVTTQSVPPTVSSAASSTTTTSKQAPRQRQQSPLAMLKTTTVLRSWLLMSLSSYPFLMNPCVYGLQRMLHSRSILFDISRNPLLRWIFKNTFYAQFCAGENRREVRETIEEMHKVGYKGIILEYASELLEDAPADEQAKARQMWKEGLLETTTMTEEGDFVGLKWSGAGNDVLHAMKKGQDPSPEMAQAMADICDSAANRNIRLLPAAEPQNANAAVDAWNLELCRKYNNPDAPKATIYNTYQCYLKSTPKTLARHLAYAAQHNFRLGIKLVRGAYLETEPRHLIWDTKAETDEAYDKIAECILKQEYSDFLKPAPGAQKTFPRVDIVLATHNEDSVTKAQILRNEQVANGVELVPLSYAQLQGMADEVSCALVQTAKETSAAGREKREDVPEVYKCVTWGTMHECLNYLLRRAAENKDAMGRTHGTRDAMRTELFRRFRATFGPS